METKILYVLVSSPKDCYLEQAYISAYSARAHNPSATIVLLTDQDTEKSFQERGAIGVSFPALFDEIVSIELEPSLTPMLRSRILKTGMRSYVKGDFLYIDSDTLIVRPLDAIDSVAGPLAACRDLHCDFPDHPHRGASLSYCRKLGFDASREPVYFNGGVMLARDQAIAYDFFARWQKNYLEGQKVGVRPDQPSLAKTIAEMDHPLVLLDDVWNCQMQNGVRYMKDAFIFHYVCTNVASGEEGKLFCLNDRDVLMKVRNQGIEAVRPVVDDFFQGFASSTQLYAGEDLFFFQTRRYKWLRRSYRRDGFSLLEWLLKVKDHLLKRV